MNPAGQLIEPRVNKHLPRADRIVLPSEHFIATENGLDLHPLPLLDMFTNEPHRAVQLTRIELLYERTTNMPIFGPRHPIALG